MYPRVHSDGRTLLSCLECQSRLDFHTYNAKFQKIPWRYDQDLKCDSPVASRAEAGVEGHQRGLKHLCVSRGTKISRRLLLSFVPLIESSQLFTCKRPLSEIRIIHVHTSVHLKEVT